MKPVRPGLQEVHPALEGSLLCCTAWLQKRSKARWTPPEVGSTIFEPLNKLHVEFQQDRSPALQFYPDFFFILPS
jgi:hypothetical protein